MAALKLKAVEKGMQFLVQVFLCDSVDVRTRTVLRLGAAPSVVLHAPTFFRTDIRVFRAGFGVFKALGFRVVHGLKLLGLWGFRAFEF